MTIQEKLDELTPYVTAIRHGDVPIVDISIPSAWGVPESKKIAVTKVESKDAEITKCLIYGNTEHKVSTDELLEYVTKTVKLNIELEKKRILLREKITELTTLFSSTPLSKLENLRFSFEVERVETISLGTIDEDVPAHPPGWSKEEVDENDRLQAEERAKTHENDTVTDTVTESVEDEEPKIHNANGMRVELPPKKKEAVPVEEFAEAACNCGGGEVCPTCTDF